MGRKYQEIPKGLTIQYNCVSISTYVHPIRDASKSRNGFVHPMIPVLIATALSCSDAEALISKMRTYKVEEETRSEMIQIVKEETPGCWDAND